MEQHQPAHTCSLISLYTPRNSIQKAIIESRININHVLTKSVKTLYHTIPTFNNPPPRNKPFENIVGKGENAGNQHFLLFPHFFSTRPQTNFICSITFIFSSANAFDLDWCKILLFGKNFNASPSSILPSWSSHDHLAKFVQLSIE